MERLASWVDLGRRLLRSAPGRWQEVMTYVEAVIEARELVEAAEAKAAGEPRQRRRSDRIH